MVVFWSAPLIACYVVTEALTSGCKPRKQTNREPSRIAGRTRKKPVNNKNELKESLIRMMMLIMDVEGDKTSGH